MINDGPTDVERMKRVTLPITPEILLIRDRLRQETGIDMTYVQVIDHIAHAYLDCPQEKEMPQPITPDYFTEEHAVAMTLRDYFAAKAMQAIVSSANYEFSKGSYEVTAKAGYALADSMLKAREGA